MRIGRVLVPQEFRSEGHGRELLKIALDYIICKYPKAEIEIQAEAYLKDFYESFGFRAISDLYYDEEIGHYDMELKKEEPVVTFNFLTMTKQPPSMIILGSSCFFC
ncbi:MAG: GNAT family N-acetyltransferase [Alkalibacterium thalassium]|nr:GNAT family N-acetyltransferase [Alkalibacterium thalassium]